PSYRRFTIALVGVATPSELIADHQRTPFNIGKAIALDGFQQHDAHPLIPGLTTICNNPDAVLARILFWTGGQPFLTQKLCQLILDDRDITGEQEARPSSHTSNSHANSHHLWDTASMERIPRLPSLDVSDVDRLVHTRILTNWEAQDEPEHLKTIRDYLISNEYRAGRLLGLYQFILEHGSTPLNDSPEHMELLLSGLVMKSGGTLALRNRIYGDVFNRDWVNQQLSRLRPYATALTAWLTSDCRDESRLLRGQTLQEAQVWSSLHSLSDEDYQFLTASQVLEQRETQQRLKAERTKAIEAQLVAESERAQEAEKRLTAETESAKRQRWFLAVVSLGMVIASTLGVTTFFQYRRAVESQQQAELREIEAIATSAEALLASHQSLDAGLEAIRAMQQLQALPTVDTALQFQVTQILRQIIYGGVERNRFSGHRTNVEDVAIHPDNHLLASASADGTIKLWNADGALLKTLTDHRGIVLSVAFSPDGQLLASGSYDTTVRLWNTDGTLLNTFEGHEDDVTAVAFSPDSQRIASASIDSTIKVWTVDGTLVHTIQGHDQAVRHVVFSPDGQYLASLSDDKSIKLWNSDGNLVRILEENWLGVFGVAFSPDSRIIATSSLDNIKLWALDGTLIRILEGGGKQVTFSPDGQRIAAVNDDAVRLWSIDGTPLPKLPLPSNHQAGQIAFSSDGQYLASAAGDRTVRLWQITDTPLTALGHPLNTHDIAFSPDGKSMATAGWDHAVRLWSSNGELRHILRGHAGQEEYEGQVNGVAFSPDSQLLASSGADNTIKLWQLDGTLVNTLDIGDYNSQVYATTFSPDGELLLSVAWGGPIQLWNVNGTLLQTLEGSDKNGGRGTFSPDGQFIAAPIGIDDVIKLWRRDGTLLHTFEGHQGWVTHVVFSPDGQHLISTGADQTIKIWSLNGELLRTIEAHDDVIKAIAISPDGQLIASGGRDGMVKLWRWDGTLVAIFPQSSMVWGIAFHPDGNQLAWTGVNNVTILNDLDLAINGERLLSYGCHWLQDYVRTNAEVEEGDRSMILGCG
ncbi:MAG: hypothetical protein AAGA75_27690, partial [Cyanobacteria bacterium P01_E01_bin.6]